MTTTAVPSRTAPPVRPLPTLLSLARADARQYTRHPLFLLSAAFLLALTVLAFIQQGGDTADPLADTILVAFFLGVFGFVVAHRLTTSARRSGELADTSPVGRRQRTAALCIACLVPAFVGSILTVFMIVIGQMWPAEVPAGEHVAWFGGEPDVAILAALIATGPVAALGGPLLGVAVAQWAPFRGSALLGMVVLVAAAVIPSSADSPWRALSPWAVLTEEKVVDAKIVGSWLVDGISPQWYLGFVVCLCGLAVVAALIHDPVNRRPLLWTGAALVLGAVGCFTLAVS